MADSPVFECTCELLEDKTTLDRLEARGTLRIALRTAGLDAAGVDARQMTVVLERVLPQELASRGIEGPEAVCGEITATLSERNFETVTDRAADAAATFARFGR